MWNRGLFSNAFSHIRSIELNAGSPREFVRLAPFDLSNGITISFFGKKQSGPAWFVTGYPYERSFICGVNGSNKIEFSFYTDAGNYIQCVSNENAPALDVWAHYAFTWDGVDENGLYIYINSVEVEVTRSETGSFSGVIDELFDMVTLGRLRYNASVIGNFYHVFIDDLYTFNSVLSSSNISEIYNNMEKYHITSLADVDIRRSYLFEGTLKNMFGSGGSGADGKYYIQTTENIEGVDTEVETLYPAPDTIFSLDTPYI